MLKLNKANAKQEKLRGFTLIELVVVIIILGVMAVGIGGFITLSTQTYVNVTDRDELAASARFVIERLNRELRNAVPNSIRVAVDNTTTPTKQCLEFIPIKVTTIYASLPVLPEVAANSMEVFPIFYDDGTNYSCNNCGNKIVIFPLSPADVYQRIDTSLAKSFVLKNYTSPLPPQEMSTLTFNLDSINFSEESPTKRAFIYNEPVSYCVEANRINRYSGYSFNDTQVLPPNVNILNGKKSLMAKNVVFDSRSLPFITNNASLQRNAVIQVNLKFSRDNANEMIAFNTAIHTTNTP